MRAKRSKKYRKLMHQYELAFGFREAYQVLVDSNFLRATDSFKMELIPALERTVQGKVKPLLTKCSLAAIMAAQPINPKTEKPYRPLFLPPPTELPLRHCSHNADHTPIDEIECLLSLLSPNADSKKNKEHYILASADPILKKRNANDEQRKYKREDERKEEEAMRRSRALRSQARSIPGVPIIYVKRSVMVLEPMSNPSEMVRDGVERGKFRAGLDADPMLGKRKRDGEGEGEESAEPKKKRGPKVKGPNPLSMKKPKKRSDAPAPTPKKEKVNADAGDVSKDADATEQPGGDESAAAKPKRRRRHNKSGPWQGDEGPDEPNDVSASMEVDA